VAVGFSGSLLWPFFYSWPPRSEQEVEEGFQRLADLWSEPLREFCDCGVLAAFELHPGEDLHDGVTFERFLAASEEISKDAASVVAINYDPSHLVLQYMDEVGFIEVYRDYIAAAHIKDAELRKGVRSGAYGGYQSWVKRPGRFRSLGDGQVRFKEIFAAFAEHGLPLWPVAEWECCLKDPIVGATEGVEFIRRHTIKVTERAFDDFAATKEPEKE
jgi:sugar phosphate isomerase/epimerase